MGQSHTQNLVRPSIMVWVRVTIWSANIWLLRYGCATRHATVPTRRFDLSTTKYILRTLLQPRQRLCKSSVEVLACVAPGERQADRGLASSKRRNRVRRT